MSTDRRSFVCCSIVASSCYHTSPSHPISLVSDIRKVNDTEYLWPLTGSNDTTGGLEAGSLHPPTVYDSSEPAYSTAFDNRNAPIKGTIMIATASQKLLLFPIKGVLAPLDP